MNFIKNVRWTFIYGFILYFVAGCNDFLTKNDPSHFSTDTFYTNSSEAQQGVNAIYASTYSIYSGQAWMIDLVRTGIVDTDFSQDAGYSSLIVPRNLGNFSQHPYLSTIWNAYYQGIANANIAISQIPGVQMDQTEQDGLLGEARFLRAYFYFNLVRMFGKVPLIKKPVSLDSPKLDPKRASVDSVYNFIVEDLTTAEKSGLPFNDESGRVTLGAVKSLLSTVYLTMAGYPLQKGDQYYKLARNEAKEVIDSGEYSLFDSYGFLRNESANNRGEYIFEIQFDQNNHPNNSLQLGLIPYRRNISEYSAEEGFVFVLPQFIDSYEVGDIRTKGKEFFFTNYTLASNRSDTAYFGDSYIYKFFNDNAHLNTAKSGLNWPVIRYPEVLLNYAEASNEISGTTLEAYEAVNKIRKRAGIPNLSGLTPSEFKEAVWMERYHEQCFENQIWFLMARTRKALNLSTEEFEDYVGHTFSYGISLKERDLLFPLPRAEIRNNPNLKQNRGF